MLYVYTCKNCGDIFEVKCKLDERLDALEQPCENCLAEGSIEQMMTVPHYIDAHKTMHGKKVDEGFRDVLRQVHKNTPGSTLDQSVGYRL